jgi:hypothetical protein
MWFVLTILSASNTTQVRVKTAALFPEFNTPSFESEKILSSDFVLPATHLHIIPTEISYVVQAPQFFSVEDEESNPTLNLLYLGHSPPNC